MKTKTKLTFLGLCVLLFLTACGLALAYFTDRASHQMTFTTASFNQDGYSLTREAPSGPFIAGEDVVFQIKETNEKSSDVTSVITMSVTWASPDSSLSVFGNANSEDNAVVSIGGTTIEPIETSARAVQNKFSFELPAHLLTAGAVDQTRELTLHIPDSFVSTGMLNFTFEQVLIADGNIGDGFSFEANRDDLNASEELDFSTRVGWAASEKSAQNGKALMGFLVSTDTAGEYEIKFRSEFNYETSAMKDFESRATSKWSFYKDAVTKLSFPENGMTSIGDFSFSDFSKLNSVTIPSSVQVIGKSAFDHAGLTGQLLIPDSVTEIKSLAFGNLPKVNSIFFKQSGTASLALPDNAAGQGNAGAFHVGDNIKTYVIGLNPAVRAYSWVNDHREVTFLDFGLNITSQPNDAEYMAGEVFDSEGMEVLYVDPNGTVQKLTDKDYTISPSGGLSAGDTKVTISYSDGSTTHTVSIPVTVLSPISTVPVQSNTLTYTGSAQTPTWSNYSTTQLTLGGTTSGTNAGSYSATFTPKTGYCWSNGSTTSKTVTWKLGKKSLVIPSQSGTLTYTGSAQTPSWSNYSSSTMTLGGTTSGTNATSYSASFTLKSTTNYQWSDGTTAAKSVTWKIGKASISTTPSQKSTLTYTGSTQSPTWNNYSSTQLTLGGTTSGTNAASYSATFTPKANYQWSDGTSTAKTVTWTIGKAAGSSSLSSTSLSIEAGTSKTITVTRSGNGTVSATSGNTSIATVSVSGTTVTVKGVAKGTATITVKVAAGTNHTAPSNKTVSATVTPPIPMLAYSTTDTTKLNTWAKQYITAMPVQYAVKVRFLDSMDDYTPLAYAEETYKWDASAKGDGSITCISEYNGGTTPNAHRAYILSIIGNGSGKIRLNPQSANFFGTMYYLYEITGLDLLDTSYVEDLSYFFGNPNFKTTLDGDYKCVRSAEELAALEKWDVSNVKNTSYMFYGVLTGSKACLDLTGWDVSKVTDMNHMFYKSSLGALNLSGWDTGNVTTMESMFQNTSIGRYNGSHEAILNLGGWDLSKVTTMKGMFNKLSISGGYAQEYWPHLNLYGWNPTHITNNASFFYEVSAYYRLNCYVLSTAVKNWITSTSNYAPSTDLVWTIGPMTAASGMSLNSDGTIVSSYSGLSE